ncbi:MAG TPA: DUF2065 domain-containing protein [Aestuariivirgaceae bacterium]|jgi:uncharacterized protein YjeT (DUF2065 family)
MSQILTAAGLVLVIEGLLYALVPRGAKRMMSLVLSMNEEQLRIGGMIAIAVGVAIVWLGRTALGPS